MMNVLEIISRPGISHANLMVNVLEKIRNPGTCHANLQNKTTIMRATTTRMHDIHLAMKIEIQKNTLITYKKCYRSVFRSRKG
jgi:hypothetical protein